MRATLGDIILIALMLVLVWLVLNWVIKVTVNTGKTLLTIGLILGILQFGFGSRALLTRTWELWQKWWPSVTHLFLTQCRTRTIGH